MRTVAAVLAVFIALMPLMSHSAEPSKVPLNVLYLGRTADEPRTKAFKDFLSARFRRCTVAKRDDFQAEMLKSIDVVVLDWSQDERVTTNYKSPVGPLEEWNTPTVLLGSAGLIIAGPWNVIGGAG